MQIPKEILEEFIKESVQLVAKLEEILTSLEDDIKQLKKFEEFGQIIDRIMGAAKSLGLSDISTMCELGKVIGYKAGQSNNTSLHSLVVPILFDCIDIIKKKLQNLQNTNANKSLQQINTKAFITRLKWLSEKFADIKRSSVKVETKKIDVNKNEEDDDGDFDDLIGMLDDE